MYSWFGIIFALIGGITNPKELLFFVYMDSVIITIYKILKRLGIKWQY